MENNYCDFETVLQQKKADIFHMKVVHGSFFKRLFKGFLDLVIYIFLV